MDHHNIIEYKVDGIGNYNIFCREVKAEEDQIDIEPKLEPEPITREQLELDKQKPTKCKIDSTGDSFNFRDDTNLFLEVKTEEHDIDIQIKIESELKETVPTDINTLNPVCTGDKPFPCSHCEKYFANKNSLAHHQNRHTGGKLYQCRYCEECFAHLTSLNRHLKLHTGEKPYKCSHCGKCFIQKNTLVLHQRIHTGEKPYQCNICKICFTYPTSLLRHQTNHTPIKPYQCNNCGKYFDQENSLVRHQRTVWQCGGRNFLFSRLKPT